MNDINLYNSFTKVWWNPSAKFYALRMLNEPRLRCFDQFIPDQTGLKAFQIGCGGGFASEFIADQERTNKRYRPRCPFK